MYRAQRFLFTIYLVVTPGITAGTIVSPKMRTQVPVPLRNWVTDKVLERKLS
jgi:hypothetical protein